MSLVNLVELLLEESWELGEMTLDCPECNCIQDDQYHCITCEGISNGNGEISVASLLEVLIKENKNG